jgi:hypothetical protein
MRAKKAAADQQVRPEEHRPNAGVYLMNGLYVAYASGWLGNSVILFRLYNGRITGIDGAGVCYRGTYELDEAGNVHNGTLSADFGNTENDFEVARLLVDTTLELPPNFHDSRLHTLSTPTGEVGLSFQLVERL